MGAVGDIDVVSGGRDRPRRWPIVVVAVVVGLLMGGRWVDHVQRHHEFTALMGATVNAEAAVTAATSHVHSTRQYALALLELSSSVSVRTGLAQFIDEAAGQGVAEVTKTRNTVAEVNSLPWHHSIRQAQAADLAYLDGWIGYLDNLAHGGNPQPVPTDAMTNQFIETAAALHAAAPTAGDVARADSLLSATHQPSW